MIVYGIDIGVYHTGVQSQVRRSDTSFAWARVDGSPGVFNLSYRSHQNQLQLNNGLAFTCGQDINDLCQHVTDDLENSRVAIGMEAPMWFPIHSVAAAQSASFAMFSNRFHQEQGLGWWMQSGAAAKVKATSVGYTILNHICNHAPLGPRTAVTLDTMRWRTGEALLYEGFVGGAYKLSTANDDIFDAFTSGAAFWGLNGGGAAVSCTATVPPRSPASFHAAQSQQGDVFSAWSAIANRAGLYNWQDIALDCQVVGFPP